MRSRLSCDRCSLRRLLASVRRMRPLINGGHFNELRTLSHVELIRVALAVLRIALAGGAGGAVEGHRHAADGDARRRRRREALLRVAQRVFLPVRTKEECFQI